KKVRLGSARSSGGSASPSRISQLRLNARPTSAAYNVRVIAWRAPSPARAAAAAALAGFLAVGLVGTYRYVDNYWLYRGFSPPRDPAFVKEIGTTDRLYVVSPALGGRRQPVDIYLPPGYTKHPHRRYPVLYL